MNSKNVIYFRAFIALAALLGFVYLYGRAMIETIIQGSTPAYNEAYTYVATILAGLVGGVAALGLGQSSARGVTRRMLLPSFGRTLAPFQPENVQNILGIVYTVIYIVFGLAALIIWISAGDSAVHEMIRNLALIFFGLAVATAQAFFGLQPDPNAVRAVKPARKHHK